MSRENGLYMLAQDRLSTSGNFILCDACVDRCPIRYVSAGYENLFGFKARECLGTNCGDLVGKRAILAKDPGLSRVAKASGLTPKQVEAAIDCQTARIGQQVRQLMAYPRASNIVTYEILLNVSKNGDLRVIEVVMMSRTHPIGLPYLVGIQHDVTETISIAQLFHAELHKESGKLAESRQEAVCEKLTLLGKPLPSHKTSKLHWYLDEKAVDMWRLLLKGDQMQLSTSQALRLTDVTPPKSGQTSPASLSDVCAASSPLKNGVYMLAQDRLSTLGNFILCDACTDRCPIRYVSLGFEELYGLTASESLGKNCGDLVAKPAILAKDPGLTRSAEASGLTPKQVAEAIDRQTTRVSEQVQRLLAYPQTANTVVFELVLNVTKNGDLRVIELVMMRRQHPIGWHYAVGIQYDITQEVSINQLLLAELHNEIGKLAGTRHDNVCGKLALLGTPLPCDTTSKLKFYLDEKALEVWSALLEDDRAQLSTTQGDALASGKLPQIVSLGTTRGGALPDPAPKVAHSSVSQSTSKGEALSSLVSL